MELFKDLGVQVYGKSKRSIGLFICPECREYIEIRLDKGRIQKTCIKCRGTQNISHGMSGKPVYYVWQAMRDRCSNANNPKYHIYGGKGITVCNEWQTFEGFWKDMEEGYYKGMTIDRIDSNQGYNKENCQWISHSDNSSKTSKVRPVSQYYVVKAPKNTIIHKKDWPSALSAAQELGLTAACITMVCQGKNKTHGGFVWKYTGDTSSTQQSSDTNTDKENSDE
jgi:hypothetical protein